MKKAFSIFLTLSLISQVACVHAQNVPINNQSTVSSDVSMQAADASVDSFSVELPPLPEPQPLPRLATDGGVGPNGEVIAPLRADARAPFTGVLFNGPALAYVEVEYRAVQQRCMIDRRRETQEVVARYQAQLDRMQVSLDATNAQHRIIVQGRDREIAQLNRIVDQQREMSQTNNFQMLLWLGGGLLAGSVIAGTAAFVITR